MTAAPPPGEHPPHSQSPPAAAMDHVAVVGTGLMGAGIALAFAMRGYEISLFDPDPHSVAVAQGAVLSNARDFGRPNLDLSRIHPCKSMAEAVGEADIVFECAPERLEIKRQIFAQLGDQTHPQAVLASNTSVIPISRISRDLGCATRILGTHWWNPAYLVPLVEVVPTERTEDDHVVRTMELLRRIGKSPVRIDRDITGFVGNRLQFALWREAQALVADGVCDARTLDDIVKSSFGPRLTVLGPMENADLIGLDLTLDIERIVIPELDHARRPNALLERLVAAGKLGFKTGSGFREWTPESIADCRRRLSLHLQKIFGPGGQSRSE